MMVKIDTREKFHVITIHESVLAANMTEKMDKVVLALLDDNVKNIVLNMKDIKIVDSAAASHLLHLQRRFNEARVSFVVCAFQSDVRKELQQSGMLDELNYTPTESEAADIVQMEEMEREIGEL
jgi:anti-anti-sigma factor